MQTHGNEEYIKAFIEYGFHPLKRYKCFTRSVLVLACSFVPLLFQKFMEVDFPILGFFSVGVGAIVSVLLICALAEHTPSRKGSVCSTFTILTILTAVLQTES